MINQMMTLVRVQRLRLRSTDPFSVHSPHSLRLSSRTFAKEFIELRPEREADSPAQRPSLGQGRNRAVLSAHAALQVLFCKHNLPILNNKFPVLRTLKHNISVGSLLSLSSTCLNRNQCLGVLESSLNKTLRLRAETGCHNHMIPRSSSEEKLLLRHSRHTRYIIEYHLQCVSVFQFVADVWMIDLAAV